MKSSTQRVRLLILPLLLLAALALVLIQFDSAGAQRGDLIPENDRRADLTTTQKAFLTDREPNHDLPALSATPCVGGMAGAYFCNNIDLLAFMPLSSIGGGSGNDVWGWTSPEGREIALMGRTSGTSFVDVSDPVNPVYLGNLPTHSSNSSWRDIKTYADHAFIVSEASSHGMQVFDLTTLPAATAPGLPMTFSETAHYAGVSNSHNIVINEDTGFAYLVGTNTCGGGLHFVDINTPTAPVNSGCFSSDGYTHDAQCVTYNGPDTDYTGAEICFNANEDTLTIVDVTNKAAPVQIARVGYSGSGYSHQGWLWPNHKIFVLDDELDELNFGHNTRTRYWRIRDLDNPVLVTYWDGSTAAIDHNQYVKGRLIYQSNYRAGLRVVKPPSTELAYFDIYPSSDSASFNGSWSNYPFFDSGTILISGIEQGLFMVEINPTVRTQAEAAPTIFD